MRWLRRIGVAVVGLLALAVAGLVIAGLALHRPLPEGVVGDEADAVARTMLQAIDADAWERTGAVRWTYAGRQTHLWDRTRGLHRLERGDLVVMYALEGRAGKAWRGGVELSGHERDAAIEDAWASFCNDAFWLNPVVKAFDDGTTRSLVQTDGAQGLMVSYSSGGVTPGDSYLWSLDATGRPTEWRMWVSILPIGGVRTTWEGWTELPTGAWVSTEHRFDIGPVIAVTDLAAAATLAELYPDEDPFAALR